MSSPFASSALFKPIRVGNQQLDHRIVLCPLNRRRCDNEYAPTDSMIEYYRQRATPNALVIMEATMISADAGAYPHAPGIYSTHQIQQWRKVTDAVHEKPGATAFLQIRHAGRASTTQFLPGAHPRLVSASAVPVPGKNELGNDYEIPQELTVDEINKIVNDFSRAARNAVEEAGFDGVEIHGANGYLIDQFINTSCNKRADAYGGSIEHRSRFCLQVVDAVVAAIGVEKTAIRFSPWSEFLGMEDATPYETWSYLVSQLEQQHPNMAYIHFIEPRDDFSRKTKNDTQNSLDPFRKLWSGPFISAGGYTTKPELAAQVADSTNNLIAFGRSFIANPDLVERLKHNWPLNKYNRETFYKGGDTGYIDYPFYESTTARGSQKLE